MDGKFKSKAFHNFCCTEIQIRASHEITPKVILNLIVWKLTFLTDIQACVNFLHKEYAFPSPV